MVAVNLLDQSDVIRKIDRSNMLHHLNNVPVHCLKAMARARQVKDLEQRKYKNIIVGGMGGSGIGGAILRDWLRDQLPIPIVTCTEYTLPHYAGQDTLFIATSYSGNTEETLSTFHDAMQRGCAIITITSGGSLRSLALKREVPCVTAPSALPPRAALPYLFFPLPVLLGRLGLLGEHQTPLQETVQILKQIGEENSPETPTTDNPAKKLAVELRGTIPVIYGHQQYQSIAHRMKTQFNENSKLLSKYEVIPEVTHNEVVGWEAPHHLTRIFSVILLRDRSEPVEITQRIEIIRSIVHRKAAKVLEISAKGTSKIAKMFSLLHLGDFTSVYLGILQGIDPTPVKAIDTIKDELEKRRKSLHSENGTSQ